MQTYEKARSTVGHCGVICNPLVDDKDDQISEYAHQKDHLRYKFAENVDRVFEISIEAKFQTYTYTPNHGSAKHNSINKISLLTNNIRTAQITMNYITICSHLHHSEPGLLRGWPFGVEWSPIGSPVTSKRILPEIPSAT